MQLPFARDMDACSRKQYNTDALLDGAEGRNSGEMHTTCTCYECWSADKENGSVDSFKMHQGKTTRACRLCEGVPRPCVYLFFFNAYCRSVDTFQRKKHIEQNSQQKIQFRRDAQVQDGPLAWLLVRTQRLTEGRRTSGRIERRASSSALRI